MITVSIIEDDHGLRESLAIWVDGSAGFSCTGTYSTCEEAFKSIAEDRPDVILLDIELPA